jgi:hypothetical protein
MDNLLNDNLLEGMINDSFDRHYKLVQSFRNQYLNMVRMILKNKRQNNLTLEEILAYHDVEQQIQNLRKTVSTLVTNKYNNFTKPDNDDVKMIRTLKVFLPFMIAYYNSMNNEIQNKNKNENENDKKNENENHQENIIFPPLD